MEEDDTRSHNQFFRYLHRECGELWRNPGLSLVREGNGKFMAAENTQEGRELSSSTRYKLFYNKLLGPGETMMKRMRKTRPKRTKCIHI